jgi:photosystem II stability/assembly factor-like uncharacterized protein
MLFNFKGYMMKNILFITLVLLSINANSEIGSNHSEMMPNFTQSLYLGIATNNSLIVSVGERGHVALSNDYGATWQQSEKVPTRVTLTAVAMINTNIWAVGHDTTIIYSPDGGETWQKQFEDEERQMPLLDVMFINESEGFAIGAYGTYLTTFDGGKNWNDSLLYDDHDFHLNKIIKVDEFKLFVVAEAGNAYRSYDMGKNWESLELPYSGSMFGVVQYNNQLITYGLRGNVLVTDDFGDNFVLLDSPIKDSLFGSAHTFSNKLLLTGANGAVLQFKNNTLSKIDIPDSDGDFTDVLSIKNNKLVIVGESGISTKQIR